MRKSLFLAVILSLVFAVSAQAAETKVGVFNSRAVAAKCDALTAALKKLESQFAGEKNQLEKQQADLRKRADELQTQGAAMSAQAREDKATALKRMGRDFEDKYQTFMRKVETSNSKVQQEFFGNLAKAAQEYGTRSGYSILLDTNMGGPVFFDKSVDVTADIITEINKIYKPGSSK
jgi:outer membrane protein